MNAEERAHARSLAAFPRKVAEAFLRGETTPALLLSGYIPRYEEALQAAEERAEKYREALERIAKTGLRSEIGESNYRMAESHDMIVKAAREALEGDPPRE